MTSTPEPPQFTWERWARLVSREYTRADIEIMLIRRLGKACDLCIPKTEMKKCFPGFTGLRLGKGDPTELIPRPTASARIEIPRKVINRLHLRPRGLVCIAHHWKTDRFFLRRFELAHAKSEIPGCLVIDRFEDTAVKRVCHSRPDVNSISNGEIRRVASAFGRLRHDPLAALDDARGRVGYLFRKHFRKRSSEGDRAFQQQCARRLLASQNRNGSWDDNLVTTAYNLIRLAEIGKTMRTQAVEKACHWLLSTPEAIGLPGLFMATVALTEEFNNWKSRPNCTGKPIYERINRQRSKKYGPVRDPYEANWDIVPGICEKAVTSSTAVVLQALFRFGLTDHKRVQSATNTLLAVWNGRWCGCGLLSAHREIPESTRRIDFSAGLPIPSVNESIYRGDWFPENKSLIEIKASRWTSPHFNWLDIGGNQTLIEKRSVGMGDCTLGIHDAFSYHPLYAGSNLEAIAALEFARRQSACGYWGDTHLVRIFHSLARLSHPLAAFLVMRSIPVLLRTQRPDGLWGDQHSQPPHETNVDASWQNTADEVLSFTVLKALDRFGFLPQLLPGKSKSG